MNQESTFLECITIMHKQSYISFLMIARSKRTYIMYVCLEDILFGMLWSPACPFLHGFTICMERNANGSALFMFSLRNLHQMCGTFSATICWFPCLIGSWLACNFRLYSSQVSIHTISHLSTLFRWISTYGRIFEGFANCTAYHIYYYWPVQNDTTTPWGMYF